MRASASYIAFRAEVRLRTDRGFSSRFEERKGPGFPGTEVQGPRSFPDVRETRARRLTVRLLPVPATSIVPS
jgi:hypothetical protein